MQIPGRCPQRCSSSAPEESLETCTFPGSPWLLAGGPRTHSEKLALSPLGLTALPGLQLPPLCPSGVFQLSLESWGVLRLTPRPSACICLTVLLSPPPLLSGPLTHPHPQVSSPTLAPFLPVTTALLCSLPSGLQWLRPEHPARTPRAWSPWLSTSVPTCLPPLYSPPPLPAAVHTPSVTCGLPPPCIPPLCWKCPSSQMLLLHRPGPEPALCPALCC